MWTPNTFKLFLSHLSDSRDVAHQLKTHLANYQISCFVAHDDIEPTREWENEIEEALRSMDGLAALLTPGFHQSKWTDQEVGFAMGSGRLVLPLRYGANPHGFIGKYQGYTIKECMTYPTIASEICKVLSRHPTTSVKMTDALINKLEDAWSWDSAKSAMTLLEEASLITEDALQRIEATTESNGQVADAWGLPDRIKVLVQRHRKIGDAEQTATRQSLPVACFDDIR
ncbi:MAG: hypothetical protein RLZZ245_2484 [Verrucomicrobiota bacterium]